MMCSSYLSGGKFLATSTPVRWLKDGTSTFSGDSGYFGSCERNSSGKGSSPAGSSALFSSTDSSVGQVPPTGQIDFLNLTEELIIHERIPPFHETLSEYELNFKNSSLQVRPECGTKKRRHVDFLEELGRKNCPRIVSRILEELSAEDLRSASCVGRGWRDAIAGDRDANWRRKKSVLEAKRKRILALSEKENKLGQHQVDEREHKTAFCDITNQPHKKKQPLYTQADTRFNSYLQGAETLAKGEVLSKCPRCRFASKLRNGNYVCTGCSYTFCAKCRGPANNNHDCGNSQVPSIVIGSKRSKRNLKRL